MYYLKRAKAAQIRARTQYVDEGGKIPSFS